MANEEPQDLNIEPSDPQAPPPPLLYPETELWIPPDDTPAWLIKNHMPVAETAASELAWRIMFYPTRPDWWTDGYGLRVVNLRREFVYNRWKAGEMDQWEKFADDDSEE